MTVPLSPMRMPRASADAGGRNVVDVVVALPFMVPAEKRVDPTDRAVPPPSSSAAEMLASPLPSSCQELAGAAAGLNTEIQLLTGFQIIGLAGQHCAAA